MESTIISELKKVGKFIFYAFVAILLVLFGGTDNKLNVIYACFNLLSNIFIMELLGT